MTDDKDNSEEQRIRQLEQRLAKAEKGAKRGNALYRVVIVIIVTWALGYALKACADQRQGHISMGNGGFHGSGHDQ